MMWHIAVVIREFTQKFKDHSQAISMAEENVKVNLVLALNQDTLSHLDAYVTMCSSNKIAHLETIQEKNMPHPIHLDAGVFEEG